MLSQNMTCEDIIFKVTEGFDMLVYNNKIMPKYNCDCTRERVERALVSMGTEEMQKLIDEQGSANLTCQFCDKVYDFSREELCELLKSCK